MYKVRPFWSHFFYFGFRKRKLRVLCACLFLKLIVCRWCFVIPMFGN